MDLRIRVAALFEQASSYVLSERFSVSDSWVRKLRLQARAGQGLEPRQRGHRAKRVDDEGEQLLRQWLTDRPDATIAELCAHYHRERAVLIGKTTMRDTLKRMGLSRKKNSVRQRTR